MNSVFFGMDEKSLRDLCRNHIDTFESWSRRLIHEELTGLYGDDYFNHKFIDGKPLVKKEIKNEVASRASENPTRFPRLIDAIDTGDTECFFCRDNLYSSIFKPVFEPFYSGQAEIRSIFHRIVPIRNKLCHVNTISHREAEQCLCYTNDFIDVFKAYYKSKGNEKKYNVPLVLRIKDSLGNDFPRPETKHSWKIKLNGHPDGNSQEINLRSGEGYKLWLDVDSSFDSSLYDIWWHVEKPFIVDGVIAKGTGKEISFIATNQLVSYSPEIVINVIQKKEWHRLGTMDDYIVVTLGEVLPPIDETY